MGICRKIMFANNIWGSTESFWSLTQYGVLQKPSVRSKIYADLQKASVCKYNIGIYRKRLFDDTIWGSTESFCSLIQYGDLQKASVCTHNMEIYRKLLFAHTIWRSTESFCSRTIWGATESFCSLTQYELQAKSHISMIAHAHMKDI